MCVSICLLKLMELKNSMVLFCLSCDGGGVKLFIVVPLMKSNDGGISRMLLWMFLEGALGVDKWQIVES